jgi:lysine 2,3-aminomutase
MEIKELFKNEEEPPGHRTKARRGFSIRQVSICASERSRNFPISPQSEDLRKTLFPKATRLEWNDWRWQLRNRIRSHEQLTRILRLSMDESIAILQHRGSLPLAITPYYAGLLDPDNALQPIRRAVVPITDEYICSPGEAEDPLSEERDSPVAGVIHRYQDRVLFLATNFCSTNCRYCTRSRLVCEKQEQTVLKKRWNRAIEYILNNPQIRDVLISGGDPLRQYHGYFCTDSDIFHVKDLTQAA